MFKKLKPTLNHVAHPLIMLLKNVHPNIITVCGLISPTLFFIFLFLHWYLLAALSYIGLSFDFLDGMVAREHHKVTAFGAFLDSTLDRLSDGILISAFGFAHLASWAVVVSLIIASFMVSYARSRIELAAHGQFRADVGFIERPERLVLLFCIFLVAVAFPQAPFPHFRLTDVLLSILTLLSVMTFFQRVKFAYKHL